MQHILRCDYEACRQYLMNLEQGVVLDPNTQMLQTFLSHRCDGNRNIMHACVSVCFPTSNKETKEEEGRGKHTFYLFLSGIYIAPSICAALCVYTFYSHQSLSSKEIATEGL